MTSSSATWRGRSHSPAQTEQLGQQVARLARAGDVIALIGELGAGKTQFVRGLARGLGATRAAVSSPTFVFIHEYEPEGEGPVLVHIDAYRLTGSAQLDSIGWDLGTGGAEMREDAVVAIEWADRVADALGPDALAITLTHGHDDQRDIEITARGNWRPRLKTLAEQLASMLQDLQP